MLNRNLFKQPKNALESYDRHVKIPSPDAPDQMCVSCPDCKSILLTEDLSENFSVCPKCGYHFRMNARQRIDLIADAGSFQEMDAQMRSSNLLGFPNYEKKLWHARLESAENEGVVCGTAKIGGNVCGLFVMEPYYMMGSMGTVVGEKITRLFEYATEHSLPVVGYTVSGGARMQEGILSLMQMAKTSGAVKRHSDAGNLYIAVLTDPTTGGVTASFAMEADITLSEPKALIGFAGPRVIEQTLRQRLPAGFQRAEFVFEKGFLDDIVKRPDQKAYLAKLLALHGKGDPWKHTTE
ncbi:MAG: acetyl-CoA carboxylase carboxyltransferase subunit beta [Ruminococcaceae bacterium]|nr:acetyl-CoA carboxylase carboxyltransferase subunit beta [Oscillospiraceae bacterium]HHV32611.1 acetyl-CoA carboxylase carboxyltransferase subunit beta [Clostridiales bacterium]